jgi:hypothetical protein
MSRRSSIKPILEYDENGEQKLVLENKPKPQNSLKIRLDNLKTFDPLTENQKKFFDAYRQGDYFIALHGVAGTGKCQGEDVEVNLMVSDEIYEKLNNL